MVDKNKTETVADPLEERRNIMSQHLTGSSADLAKTKPKSKTKTSKTVNRQSGNPASQLASKEEDMVKVTFRLPDSLHVRLEKVQASIKLAKLDQPKDKRKVLVQDLFMEAVTDYVSKMERKYKLQ